MQFKNLSVAKKIWLLMLAVMGTMLTAGIAMTSYMTNVEDRLRDEILSVDERMRVVVELRGAVETAASFLVAGNLAQDPASMDFFDRKYQEARDRSANLLDRTTERLATEEGKALMRNINDHRNKLLASAELIAGERRNDGDVAGMVQSQLVPAVTAYLDELNAMVALQEKLRADTLSQGQDARVQAITYGGVTLALVFVFGLIMSAWLVRQINAPLARAVDLANSIADGDLSRDVHDDRQDELGQLLRSLNTMTQKLRAVVGEVRNGVDSVSSAASQIASGNQDLSARTEQTAANLEETAASVEELTATVTQSADTARQANQLAATAVQAAERGGEVVSQVVMSMDQINSSSRKISDIIGVIDGIAFQTNILALNAAVEAARAGEQGRGFAVVAGEVRSLAQRSAEAAKEIKALITASVTNVDIGAEQVAQAGESMQEIVASVRRVTDLIGEISASVSEQRDGFAQVNQAVSNLDQMTQQNAALVEESSAAATSMNEQAQRLSEVVSMFNVGQSGSQPMAVRCAPTLTSSAAAPAKAAAPAVQTAARKPLAAPATSHMAAAKPAAPAAKPFAAPQLAKPAAPVASKTTSNDDDWETF
ncbi:MAG: methyl-accepting chemotaxis protein [Comamonas sp.]